MSMPSGNDTKSRACISWWVNTNNWVPSSEEWTVACSLLSINESTIVNKFVFERDRKMALISRLLQKRMLANISGLSSSEIIIHRTSAGKPYWDSLQSMSCGYSLFSFSVSHHAGIVVIVGGVDVMVGVDVMDMSEIPRNSTIPDFITTFSDQLSKDESTLILSQISTQKQLALFYKIWTMKEAYTKAIGIGLGFNFRRLTFQPYLEDAIKNIYIDETILNDWYIINDIILGRYVVSIAVYASCINNKEFSLNEIDISNLIKKVYYEL